MSYYRLLDRQLAVAFNQLKSLAEEAQFIRKESTGFDFNTVAPVSNTEAPKTLKVVILSEKKKGSTVKCEILFRSSALGDTPTAFSKVQIGETSWTVGPVVAERQYVTLLEIYRE